MNLRKNLDTTLSHTYRFALLMNKSSSIDLQH